MLKGGEEGDSLVGGGGRIISGSSNTTTYGAVKSGPSSPSTAQLQNHHHGQDAVPLFTCFKFVLLFTLIIINTIEFCHRMLLFNLAATPTPHCTRVSI